MNPHQNPLYSPKTLPSLGWADCSHPDSLPSDQNSPPLMSLTFHLSCDARLELLLIFKPFSDRHDGHREPFMVDPRWL